MMRDMFTSARLFAAVVAATVLVVATAGAQQGPANALQGFSSNRGQPVKIQAASLEVRDKDKVATFSGDVHVVQGDTNMRCKTLLVYYEGGASADGAKSDGVKAAQPGGGSQIRRMEAHGNVVVTQKDQVATGDRGDFDMRANTVTLTGKVVVTKGQDLLRGERLVVNLTDGVSRMEGGRIEGLFNPKSNSDQKSAPGLPTPARKK
jgi:lipopolysaccharide export system protein LptA